MSVYYWIILYNDILKVKSHGQNRWVPSSTLVNSRPWFAILSTLNLIMHSFLLIFIQFSCSDPSHHLGPISMYYWEGKLYMHITNHGTNNNNNTRGLASGPGGPYITIRKYESDRIMKMGRTGDAILHEGVCWEKIYMSRCIHTRENCRQGRHCYQFSGWVATTTEVCTSEWCQNVPRIW